MPETRKQRAGLLRAVAYGYAMMTALMGLGLLAFLVVLYAAFGLKPSDWLLVALFVIPAIVCLALAPFIWRQKGWAMFAALGLIVTARAMIGIDNSQIGWSRFCSRFSPACSFGWAPPVPLATEPAHA
jgi:hypothetical protein